MIKILLLLSVVNSFYIPPNVYIQRKKYNMELNGIFNRKENKKYNNIINNSTIEYPSNLKQKITNNPKRNYNKEICLKIKKLIFLFSIVITCYILQIIISVYKFFKNVANRF